MRKRQSLREEDARYEIGKKYHQSQVFKPSEIIKKLNTFRGVAFTMLDTKLKDFIVKDKVSYAAKSVVPYHNSFEMLTRDLRDYKRKGYRVVLLSPSVSRAKRLAEDLRDYDLKSFFSDDKDRIVNPSEILVAYGHLAGGYEYPMLKFLVISESDIFGKRVKKKKRRRYSGEKIQDFSNLRIGDIVVHENHGLGIYRGIEKVEVDKVAKDYMKIEYADNAALFISATGLDVIQKYAGSDGGVPKLNKLGTGAWAKTKKGAKGAINEIAKDLVELYASRSNSEGYAYEPDTTWQKEFEEMFPFEETEDQLEAIADTKRDMESNKIMDRLICGDVGYGKTEIAIRASFKAIQEGKQVVYLVPTTILALQHYQTYTQRMKDYPVRVELLCRFRTTSQIRKTLEELRKGLVDIVIGTHRVLSKDVSYKDLGLLILDEEQRFGVRHKEKIKELKETVDVLTMTATPIPRTLHMSLIGIRDLSVLDEAPQDRMPIQTYVMEYQDEMVREAIQREIDRRGQVYYVYNRVHDIADVAGKIQRLVPDAVVAYAHGQMKERHLENIMQDFVDGEVDVLVSTTIVETGLDISNANTMIIHDADQFGLSQLYQLRGRIGRSNRMAYAFLLYRRDKLLPEVAQKRLSTIREFTELGSGIKIAMRDLEIRGAGNLLGTVQSGHMSAIGYELYCKMLGQAVSELKGEGKEERFNTVIDLNVDAYIPDTYIQNEVQKLDVYKKIATIESEEEMSEMLDELLDRFGEIPKKAYQLLRIASLKALANSVYVTAVEEKEWGYRFVMYQKADVNPGKIPELLDRHQGYLEFKGEIEPYFIYRRRGKKVMITDDEKIEFIKNVLNDFKVLLDR
jgi:transcription-repair coupling factor (superfamily II helicase)